ncbi:MAG: V-type ATPase subunit [Thermotogaceae bacterium]|nr:V-type ATPase subunit [Thermotogaceae bacterium]
MNAGVLTGKIGALVGKLLKDEDFRRLLSLKNVHEVAMYLKKLPSYKPYIPDMEEIHRRDLEASILKKNRDETLRLRNYVTYPQKKLIDHLLYRYELDGVKKLLRLIHSGEDIEERFICCGEDETVRKIMESKTVDEAVEVLKSKPYYRYLKSALNSYKESSLIGALENSLDFWYFKTLNKLLKQYSTKQAILFFKRQVDLTNIMWIYRSKILFGYSQERVLSLLLPFGLYTKGDAVSSIASLSTREEFLERLKSTPYGEIFKERYDIPEEFILERQIDKYLYQQAKELIRDKNSGLNQLIGYVHLIEYELKDLITVIETIRYSLDKDSAFKYLIRGGLNA